MLRYCKKSSYCSSKNYSIGCYTERTMKHHFAKHHEHTLHTICVLHQFCCLSAFHCCSLIVCNRLNNGNHVLNRYQVLLVSRPSESSGYHHQLTFAHTRTMLIHLLPHSIVHSLCMREPSDHETSVSGSTVML